MSTANFPKPVSVLHSNHQFFSFFSFFLLVTVMLVWQSNILSTYLLCNYSVISVVHDPNANDTLQSLTSQESTFLIPNRKHISPDMVFKRYSQLCPDAFAGSWSNGKWLSDQAILHKPVNKSNCVRIREFTANEKVTCLRTSGSSLLFIGDSTLREIGELEVREFTLAGYSSEHKIFPCNATDGTGCFSCKMGCKHAWFVGEGDADFIPLPQGVLHNRWVDTSTLIELPSSYIYFSWKPDFFSPEEARRLQSLATEAAANKKTSHIGNRSGVTHWGAIIASRGAHQVATYIDEGRPYPYRYFLDQAKAEASDLAAFLVRTFPHSLLFWREPYVNILDASKEKVLSDLRAITTPVFLDAGFDVIPGDIAVRGAFPSNDGIHQHDSVKAFVSDAVYSVLCESDEKRVRPPR